VRWGRVGQTGPAADGQTGSQFLDAVGARIDPQNIAAIETLLSLNPAMAAARAVQQCRAGDQEACLSVSTAILEAMGSGARTAAAIVQRMTNDGGTPSAGLGGTWLREVEASDANRGFGRPPYDPSRPIIDSISDGSTQYVRVYNTGPNSSQAGQWMMRADDIRGLSPQQIQDRFDLPELPTHITDVNPPQGVVIRTGTVNAGNFGGAGGGIQFQLRGRIPESSFANPRPLN
jgi:hypothetical protein